MIKRECAICGAPFDAYPSDTKRTCSAACGRELKRRSQTGSRHPWSAEARDRLRGKPKPPQLSLGFDAAMALHDSQRGPDHRSCKVWRVLSPDGEEITFTGLVPWARENVWRFGETGEDGAQRIASGIRQIALSMRGRTKRRVGSYKGWTLIDSPAPRQDKEVTVDNPRKSPRNTGSTSPITRARLAAGMTQAQLAEAIGKTQKDVSRWERGVYSPRVDVLVRIAGALGCPLEELTK